MIHSVVNYWAILVAGLAYMVLGAIWYSPVLFGNVWMKGIGKTKEQVNAQFSPMKYVWALIGSLVAAYGIARLMSWTGGDSVRDGIMVGLLTSICLVLTAFTVSDIMENRPKNLTIVNVFYNIVGFVVIGIIIGAW